MKTLKSDDNLYRLALRNLADLTPDDVTDVEVRAYSGIHEGLEVRASRGPHHALIHLHDSHRDASDPDVAVLVAIRTLFNRLAQQVSS